MRFRAAFVLTLLTASPSLAGDGSSRLHFPVNGFSIAPLEAPLSTTPTQPLLMALPATNGFAPNIIVQIQDYDGSLDDYLALTLEQLEAANFETIAQPGIEGTTLTIEYAGAMTGRDFHWYATATKEENSVFLVTATALQSQWLDAGTKLKAAVDSFRLESRR